MNILVLDIETAPNLVWVWGFFKQYISPSQVVKSQRVLCFAAKWLGEEKMHYASVHGVGEKAMLEKIHALLDKADVVVHQNGQRFDIPMLNTEFLKHGMKPYSPIKQVDLKKVSKDQFRWPTNKLEYVAEAMKIGSKLTEVVRFELWTDCMAGDEAAWEKMEDYNKQDVVLAEKLYNKYLPWIKNHPHHGSYGADAEVCPNCAGKHVQRRGYAVASLKKYPRFQCQNSKCGKWFRSNIPVPNKKIPRYIGV